MTLVPDHEHSLRWRDSNHAWSDQREGTPLAHSCATVYTTST